MEAIRCIVIDDEPLARKGLREYIDDTPFLKFEGEFSTPVKASAMLQQGAVQLLFLDIQMPKLNGIDFLKTLAYTPPVIFTTAYPQYALDGFELNALDYLVKPIAYNRFLKAAQKARSFFENKLAKAENPEADRYFFIKAENKLVKIACSDILFVEALQNYVRIYTKTKKHITYLTFKSVEDYLSGLPFIKTHKSFLVAADKIDQIEGNTIRMGEHCIPISRTNKEEVFEKLLNGRFLKR